MRVSASRPATALVRAHPKDDSRTVTTSGTMVSQSPSSVRVTVTKSPVMNSDCTPDIRSTRATRSSAASESVNVAGPPTGTPTVNFIARGFGVFSMTTGTFTSRSCCEHRTVQPCRAGS